MSKFFDFIKKHPIAVLSILVGVVTLVIAGTSFLTSYNKYNKYSDDYEDMKTKLLANTPQLPEEVYKDNEFVEYDDDAASIVTYKSSFGTEYLFTAQDAEIDLDKGNPEFATLGETAWEVATGFTNGGSITYTVETANFGMSDIDVYLGLGEIKNVPIDNLIDFITIKINGLPVTTVDFDLPSDGSLQQLVLKNTNLIKGVNTLEFATSVGVGEGDNIQFIMPAIAAVTFITDVEMA